MVQLKRANCRSFGKKDKMKKLIIILLITIISLLYAGPGDAGAAFLKIPVDARVCGMGEASVAYIDNASALYYNPAGLGKIKSIELLFMHNTWLLDMRHEYFAAAYAFRNIGTFGLSFNYWDSGDIPCITIRGDTIPNYTFSASDWAVNIGYAKELDKACIGVGFKFLSEKHESLSTTAIAFDVGGMYELPIKGLQAGISLSNFGTGIELDQERFPLPLLVRLGWQYNLQELGFAQDFIISNADEFSIALGAEYWVAEILALRFGYRTGSGMAGLTGLRAGLGVCFKNFGFDYAAAAYGQLGMTHRFSFSWKPNR